MTSSRKTALVVGVLFILTFVTSIAAVFAYGTVLTDPNYITGPGADTGVFVGAFLELFLIITNIGCAVVLFPILKRQNESIALGYVAARIMECTFILIGILSVLAVVTLRQDAVERRCGLAHQHRHVARRRQELDVPARPGLRRRHRDRADAGLADVPVRPGAPPHGALRRHRRAVARHSGARRAAGCDPAGRRGAGHRDRSRRSSGRRTWACGLPSRASMRQLRSSDSFAGSRGSGTRRSRSSRPRRAHIPVALNPILHKNKPRLLPVYILYALAARRAHADRLGACSPGEHTETGPGGPALGGHDGGRYWIRTSDPTDVNRVL